MRKIIKAKDFLLNKEMPIGRQGESNAITIVFDVTEWEREYGVGGNYALLAKQPKATDAYPCLVTRHVDGAKTFVHWLVTDSDTAMDGIGECELRYIIDDTIVKSKIIKTLIARSLGNRTSPPAPWEAWVDQVLEAIEIDRSIISHWTNPSADILTLPEDASATVIVEIIDDGVHFQFGIPKGRKGEDGYTPRKGVDYFTESEIEEIEEKIDRKIMEAKTEFQAEMTAFLKSAKLELRKELNSFANNNYGEEK